LYFCNIFHIIKIVDIVRFESGKNSSPAFLRARGVGRLNAVCRFARLGWRSDVTGWGLLLDVFVLLPKPERRDCGVLAGGAGGAFQVQEENNKYSNFRLKQKSSAKAE
jgi:hypothetical protein